MTSGSGGRIPGFVHRIRDPFPHLAGIHIRHRAVGIVDKPAGRIVVRVHLMRVRHRRAVVAGICDSVAITIPGVARIADTVAVRVPLAGIRHRRAVIKRIFPPVAIGVILAGIADAILIGILLAGIRDQRTVISGIVHAVVVVIRIAGIPLAVAIRVGLRRIRHRRAVVTGIPLSITIRVGLRRIRHRRAVVRGIRHPVAIRIRHFLKCPARDDFPLHVAIHHAAGGRLVAAEDKGGLRRPPMAGGAVIKDPQIFRPVALHVVLDIGGHRRKTTAFDITDADIVDRIGDPVVAGEQSDFQADRRSGLQENRPAPAADSAVGDLKGSGHRNIDPHEAVAFFIVRAPVVELRLAHDKIAERAAVRCARADPGRGVIEELAARDAEDRGGEQQ